MTDPTRRPKPAGAGAPRPAQPAPARPAAARPAAQPARPAPAPAPAPRGRVAAPAPADDDEPAPVRRQARRGEPQDEALDATTKKGLIAAGVMVVVAAAVWIVIKNKQAEEEGQRVAYVKTLTDFRDKQKAVYDNTNATIEQMQAAIEDIDKHPELWKDKSTEGEITTMRSRLNGRIDELKRRKEFDESFKLAQDAVANAGAKSTDELRTAKQKLDEIEGSAGQWGSHYEGQIKDMKVKIDHILVRKMREEAKAFVATNPSPHVGLAKYATAEDYVRKAVEDAKKSGNKADDAEYTEIFKGLVQDSDEYSEKVINDEFKSAAPWRDLLADNSKWSRTTNVPGFSFRLEGGVITCSPPDPGSGKEGVIGIMDQKADNLRHFILEMEFQIDGLATIYFHVPPPPMPPSNQTSEAFDMTSRGDGGLHKDEKYLMRVEYIGTKLVITWPENEVGRWEPNPSWAKRRSGGIALRIPEGTRFKVTRMKIKELR
jgi:hypothetical protein